MNRILIVNDSRFESIILSDLLSQIGYNVLVSDEYNAVKQTQVFLPDVILVNYTMKEIKGDKLIDRIKASVPETKCILTSNSILTAADVSSSVDYILRTPANRHNLEAAINEVEKKSAVKIEEDTELKDFKERISKWKSKTGLEVNNTPVPAAVLTADKTDKADGKPLSFCPYCGQKFDENQPNDFAFCPFCGHKMNKTS